MAQQAVWLAPHNQALGDFAALVAHELKGGCGDLSHALGSSAGGAGGSARVQFRETLPTDRHAGSERGCRGLGPPPWPAGAAATPQGCGAPPAWVAVPLPAHAGLAVAAPAPATAAAWQPRSLACVESDALPSAQEVMSGDPAGRLAAGAVGRRDPAPVALHRRRYLAVLFEDPEEAKRAQRGLPGRGVPEGDLRLYDGEETLRIASRLQQERSILAKAIKEIVVDHRAEMPWLGNARGRVVPSSFSMPPPGSGPTGWWSCSPTTSTGRWTTSANMVWKSSNGMPARPRPGKEMIGPAPDDHSDRHSGF